MNVTDNLNLIDFCTDQNFYIWHVENGSSFYTPSVKNLTGYTSEEITDRPGRILSIIHEDDLPEIKAKMAEIEADEDLFSAQLSFRVVKKDEETIWLKEDLKINRAPDGSIESITGVVTNFDKWKSDQLRLEEYTENLKKLNTAKDNFISIVSHDLRAPFTSLLGFSEILMNEDLPDNDRNEYVGYIYEASNSQLQLINYLLDWSRLQTGRLQIEPQNQNLYHLINNCISSLTGAIIKKKIEVNVKVDEALEVNADLRLFTQVISNLLSNAIKFTPIGKKITIIAEKFKKGMIEIIVKDEGTGISEKNQKRLFQIDQKVSTEGTGGERGTGLGLMLAKEIIEKHHGKIWFYSEENNGSEFHITVPEAQNIILLVEDDKEVRDVYRKLIEKAAPNFEIIEATNGYEAMSKILKKMPSIVITDHEMPLMSGIHLAEAVRKKDKSAMVPIVVISAKLNEEIKEEYLNFDVDQFINKPVDPEEFIDTIKEMAN